MSDTKYYVCGVIIAIAILIMVHVNPENIVSLLIRHICIGYGAGTIAARITLWLFNE